MSGRAAAARRLVLVISDLHMGVAALDDFDPEIERHFVAFLEHWRRHDGPLELVINGDLLDFVQAPPDRGAALEAETADHVPLCFTEAQSLEKFKAIAVHHSDALNALRGFLAAGKQVTVLPGNHDADLYWPKVRSAFTERISGRNPAIAARLRVHLDQVYQPAGHEHLWIEHGHQFDPVNAFADARRPPFWSEQRPPIFETKWGEPRLYECVGTRFLIRYLNHLDERYPLVDNVKPFMRFLKLFGASALVANHGPLKAAVATGEMVRYLLATGIGKPSDLMEDAVAVPDRSGTMLKAAVSTALPDELAAFSAALTAAGFGDTRAPQLMVDDAASLRRLASFTAEHLDVLNALDSGEVPGVLSLGKAFKVDETGDLRKAAGAIRTQDATGGRYVTMGHTHERVDDPFYFNTGSWTRYYRYDENEQLRPWSMLKPGASDRFPYRLEFVLSESGPPPHVALKTFARSDPA